LKANLVLLVLVLIAIIASSFAVYAGNKKFIGIIGIAALALALVLWRILSLTRQTAATPSLKRSALTSTLTASKKIAHPTSDAAATTAWKPRQTLITTVLPI
jgi:uncharacterized membrane protein YjjP (DUF1212 family)